MSLNRVRLYQFFAFQRAQASYEKYPIKAPKSTPWLKSQEQKHLDFLVYQTEKIGLYFFIRQSTFIESTTKLGPNQPLLCQKSAKFNASSLAITFLSKIKLFLHLHIIQIVTKKVFHHAFLICLLIGIIIQDLKKFFCSDGITQLIVHSFSQRHQRYLAKLTREKQVATGFIRPIA